MGAIYISRQRQIPEPVLEVFRRKGFRASQQHDFGQLRILNYSKLAMNTPNYLEQDGSRMLISGSCFYKGSTYQENLRLILDDYIRGELDYSELSGTFLIVINQAGTNFFIMDRSGSQNIFYDPDNQIVSTSFLAVFVSRKARTLNIQAISELLLTGNLIGPDTVVSEIVRFERSLQMDLPGLQNLDPYKPYEEQVVKPYRDELDRQIRILRGYFTRRALIFNDLGVISGLTGGLDSRLLYYLLRSSVANYRIYTTYRNRLTAEQSIAKTLTAKLGDELISPIHNSPSEMNTERFSSLLKENLYFNDGLIRAHQYWLEEIKSKEYLMQLYGTFRLSFSGVGGEQFRNGEYLRERTYRILDWINYDLVYRQSGISLLKTEAGRHLLFYLRRKIEALLGLEGSHLSYFAIKRYYNEVWNPSTRTLRNNIENQVVLFCSPFSDWKISQSAYSAVKHVQSGYGFECDMINAICPDMESVPTDYGFALDRPLPWRYKMQPLAKQALGFKLYHDLNRLRKTGKNSDYDKLVGQHPFLTQYIQIVQTHRLPYGVDKLLGNNTLYPLLIELGLFIEEFDEYLQSG